jgi:hypothetical protein
MPTLPITSFPGPSAGGATTVILTSASPTAATNLVALPCRLYSITNSGPAMSVFPEFFNDPTGDCPADTLFYGDGATVNLGAGDTASWPGGIPLSGLSTKISGALTANLALVIGSL